MQPTKNFHVPLSEELYSKLRKESERSQEPATEIARKAISSWLKEKEKEVLHQAILKYASQVAGSRDDLDEMLEVASIDILKQEEKINR